MFKYALFIPYRNREDNLSNLLQVINEKDVDIFILEQKNWCLFNRGRLINAGFQINLEKYDYFIIHDVDLIPENFTTYKHKYTKPTHLSCYCSQFNYKILDKKNYLDSDMFGGVLALPKKYVMLSGGFSNIFEGWGCEDNDFLNRIPEKTRFPWKYKSLKHSRENNDELNPNLYNNLKNLDKLTNDRYEENKFVYTIEKRSDNIYHLMIDFKNIYPKVVIIYKDLLSYSYLNIYLKYAVAENLNVILVDSNINVPEDMLYFYSDVKKSTYLLLNDVENIKSWIKHDDIGDIKKENIKTSNYFLLTIEDIKYYILYGHDITKIKLDVPCYKEETSFNKYNFEKQEYEYMLYFTPVLSMSDIKNENYLEFFYKDNDLKNLGLNNKILSDLKKPGKYYDIPDDFDCLNYYFNYPDLHFISWLSVEIEEHYINNGKNEERTYSDLINKKYKSINWYYYNYKYQTLDDINYDVHYDTYDFVNTKFNEIDDKTLIFTHPGGGGVEKYLKGILDKNCLVIRPNSQCNNLHQFEEQNKEILFYHELETFKLHDKILEFNIKEIIINHLYKFNPIIFSLIKNIRGIYKCNMKTILHDFSFINENPNPRFDEIFYNKNIYTDLRMEILKLSDVIISPSLFLKEEYSKHLNDNVKSLIKIIPHEIATEPRFYVKNKFVDRFRILVYGSFKGKDVITNFIKKTKDDSIDIYYYGLNNLTVKIKENVNQEYDDSYIYEIIKNVNPHLIFFPSLISESFCYALTFSIKSEFPILAYNIGSFYERLNGRKNTWLMDPYDDVVSFIDKIKKNFY